MSSIYIVSGLIQSGKTSRLMAWTHKRTNVDGILAPVQGKIRYLQALRSGEKRQLCATAAEEPEQIVRCGKYAFKADVFRWARSQLRQAFESKPDWLVIDEIGPLELRGEGLEPAVTEILHLFQPDVQTSLICVVRDTLYLSFMESYHLKKEDVLHFSEEGIPDWSGLKS
ncbi:nucleoside-triphosphatase [candidate division CSSED10-310 bacterium]|uniref:Nucleoside-triphosphatase n=1 Tax=candidate division CSSED10-310 bacterium TaxID=2855610 RepID=A0ABV6YTW3_UNCC1